MRGTRCVMMLVEGLLLCGAPSHALQRNAPGGFHPQRQNMIVARSNELTARLEKKDARLRIVFERHQKRVDSLSLPQEMAQVDSIDFAAGEKLVVLGHVNSSVRQVVVIDINGSTVIDNFYCYEPILSPDKRFLALVKFFPPHFVQGVSYQYLLYDFQKSPAANRPQNVPANDPQNVGQVLYPTNAKNQLRDNTEQPPLQVHLMASGTFFWSARGKRVAFADDHLGIVRLVVVELQGTTPILRVLDRELKKTDIRKSKRGLDTCAFTVSDIQFTAAGVKVALTPRSGEIKRKIEVRLWPG